MSRLPLEICILLLDAIGNDRCAGRWDDGYPRGCIHTLTACSLVCRAWYHHTIPYLWSSLVIDAQPPLKRSKDLRLTVNRVWWESPIKRQEATFPLAEMLNIFQSNPRLMASIRHLCLKFSLPVKKDELMATPELVNFCKALPPLPRFSWEADELDHNTIFTPSYEVPNDDDHPLGQIITSFCHSPALTAFTFSGVTFPLDILKATPNLKDISFTNIAECIIPHSSNHTSPLHSLPFRLRRASFCAAECVYESLIEFEDIFSQLEELTVNSGDHGENRAEENLATLVSLPIGKLRTLDLEITNSWDFSSAFIEQCLPFDFLTTLEYCSIRITDLDKSVTSQHRATLLDILEAAPEGLLYKLKSFELYLQIVAVPLFGTIFDPEHRAWRIAKRLLGPSVAPSLESLSITTAWSKSHTRMESDRDQTVNTSISSQCLEMLERCAPRWEGDARNVERVLSPDEPLYFARSHIPPHFLLG